MKSRDPGRARACLEAMAEVTGISLEGAKIGGGQFIGFREGWALALFGPWRAHYWRRWQLSDSVTSLCGRGALVRAMYEPGNFERCKACQKARIREKYPHAAMR